MRRGPVVADAEVRPGLEPQVVGRARMDAGRVVVLLRMRGHRQQGVVDVRGRGTVLDARPVVVLEEDDEHRVDGAGAVAGRRPRGRAGRAAWGGRGRGPPTMADRDTLSLAAPERAPPAGPAVFPGGDARGDVAAARL